MAPVTYSAPQPVTYSAPQPVTYSAPQPVAHSALQPAPFSAPQRFSAPQNHRAPQQFHGQNHVHAIESEQVTGFQGHEINQVTNAPGGSFNGSQNGGTNGFIASPSVLNANGGFNTANSGFNRPTGGFNAAFRGPKKTELPENERATEEAFYSGVDASGQPLVVCLKCDACTGQKNNKIVIETLSSAWT